jgi:hypothetical protein
MTKREQTTQARKSLFGKEEFEQKEIMTWKT